MPDTKNPLKRVDVHAALEPVSTGLAYQTPNSFGGAPRGAPGGAAACLRPLRALISDLDGTLLAGNRAQPDLQRFLDFLRKRGIALTVVTNNTVRTPAQYSQKLAAAGANVPPGQILTAAIATAAYLQAELPPASPIFVVGESGLRTALAEAGFVLLEDSAQPAAAVVVGGDRTVSHDKLKHAIRHVRRGARFIGANPDLLVPVEDGLAPEAGVLLAAIAAGAGVAPTIIGKPERPLLEQALWLMGSTPPAAAILGDRLDTDILGGQRLGLTTILVTTGVDDAAAIRASGIRPDLVVAGLGALTDLWEESGVL
jgi:4-nitrophenyl phosphatase